MGRLGLELSKSTWLSNPKNQAPKKLSLKDVPMVVEEGVEEDSAVDSIIAYVSYYVLVFVAFCAFMPAQTAYAVGYTKYAIIHTVTENIGNSSSMDHQATEEIKVNWELRETRP